MVELRQCGLLQSMHDAAIEDEFDDEVAFVEACVSERCLLIRHNCYGKRR